MIFALRDMQIIMLFFNVHHVNMIAINACLMVNARIVAAQLIFECLIIRQSAVSLYQDTTTMALKLSLLLVMLPNVKLALHHLFAPHAFLANIYLVQIAWDALQIV